MESHNIRFSNGRIHYSVFGNGPSIVIAFHGFGQDDSVFRKVADHFPEYRFIAVDLPFHGKSVLSEPLKPLTSGQMVQIVAEIQKQVGFARFSIIAFSIGARLTWPVIENFPNVLDEVILIAPESLHANIWFNVATGIGLSRTLFRLLIGREKLMLNILVAGKTLKLIDRSTEVMARKSISTAIKRQLVYHTWISLRLLRPDFTRLSESIAKYGLHLQIILGESDDIIRPRDVKRGALKIPGSRITELSCGHHQLLAQYAIWRNQQKKG